jgi:branched-chain amino acid transport system substrate-binding protein
LPGVPLVSALRSLLALIASVGVLTACGGDDEPAAIGGKPTIYVSAPLVAPLDRGRDIVDAARLALREAEGRAGRFDVVLRVADEAKRDERWSPDRVATIAREALQDDSVVAYVGGIDAGSAAVAVPILNGDSVVVVSPTATYTGLTSAVGAGKGEPERFYPSGRHTFVRLAPGDDVQAEAQADAQSAAGCRRLALVHAGDAFNDSTARLVGRAAAARGILVVAEERVRDEADGDRSLVRDIVEERPDCAFVAFDDAPRAAALARALAASGLEVFAPAALATSAFTARATITRPAGGPPRRPIVRRFAAAFRATYGRPPGAWAARGYEAMKLVLAAIAAAGERGDERDAVASAVLAAERRNTVLGDYAVQSSGDTTLRRYDVVSPD